MPTIREIADKEVTKAMEICSRTNKDSHELIRNACLPILDELGNNLVTKELVNAVQDNTSRRKQIVKVITFVSTNLIHHNQLQPVKLHTMIQTFMKRLDKDMSALDDIIMMNEATLEQLSYRRIKSLYN